jgi:hypothetical protein
MLILGGLKMNEEEKQAIELFRKMRPKTRHVIIAQMIFAAEIEKNTQQIAQGLADPGPLYADRNPAPMGAALAAEALNG